MKTEAAEIIKTRDNQKNRGNGKTGIGEARGENGELLKTSENFCGNDGVVGADGEYMENI